MSPEGGREIVEEIRNEKQFVLTFYHFMGFLRVINISLMENSAMSDPFTRPLKFVHFN